jgi:hypothetical protein
MVDLVRGSNCAGRTMCSKVVGTHARTGQVVVSGSEQLPKTPCHGLVTGARDYGGGRTAYSQDLADR